MAAVVVRHAGIDKTVAWVEAHLGILCLALVALASLRVVATYTVFNHTSDELVHVACGMQWLDKGIYQYEPQHPPLARVAAALGPYMAGIRSQGKEWPYGEGAAIYYRNQGREYDRNLSLARLGILPFFWIAALAVYVWARRYLGGIETLLAVFVFTFLPPVLAHAGLATTDMALTAFVAASFVTALIWVEKPSIGSSALFGASVGLAVLSKFSALPFIPMALAAALAWYLAVERPAFGTVVKAAGARAPLFGLAVLTGALVIWAGYRFSFAGGPAPELFAGVRQVMAHNEVGHPTYLLGEVGDTGWWYYFPVILFYKTPLPFLALLTYGTFLCLRHPRQAPRGLGLALMFSLGILLFSLTSRINIGVRHVLPVYVGFSLIAAVGASRLLDRAAGASWARWTLGLLVLWMAATSLASHPDYLPYFNALAGSEPEKIAVDSDLDWGQDMKRLGARLRELGAKEVAFSPFVLADLEHVHGFPPIHKSDPIVPAPGWNAVSLTVWKESRMGLFRDHPELRTWPDGNKAQERVGKGILLYYFPAAPQ
jgi:hypothetical protein